MIQCDNSQIIQLLTRQYLCLDMKLQHVDVHKHWLKQKVQRNYISVKWTFSVNLLADNFTKPFTAQRHTEFIRSLRLAENREQIGQEATEEVVSPEEGVSD